jgi:hypothetical protein
VDRRRPLLVNRWEVRTNAALEEAAERCGVRIYAKVRVADVFRIDHSGLTDEEYRYALQAHFDFVIVEGANSVPQFAIEFDERHHLTDPKTIRRDRLKAAICESLGLPLVRIGSEYLRRERRFTLIGYLVEVWQLQRSFDEAQQSGQIPFDEIFAPELVLTDSMFGPINFPYWLERPARLRIIEAERAGRSASHSPEEIITPWPWDGDGPDSVEFIEAWAVISLRPRGYVIGQAKLRNFKVFIPGLSARALAGNVAVADLGSRLDRVLKGELAPDTKEDLAGLRTRTVGWLSQGGVVS